MPDLNQFIQWCIETCNKDNVGYSQAYRNQQTVNGITYYDCSSFVNFGLNAGGFATPNYAPYHNAFTTYTEVTELTRLGFKEVDLNGEWQQGDILWRASHTEVVYAGGTGHGRTMGAHSSKYTLARQVSINGFNSYAKSWSKLFRYSGSGGTEPSKPTQKVSMYVIAAMCGNFMQESQINPGYGRA